MLQPGRSEGFLARLKHIEKQDQLDQDITTAIEDIETQVARVELSCQERFCDDEAIQTIKSGITDIDGLVANGADAEAKLQHQREQGEALVTGLGECFDQFVSKLTTQLVDVYSSGKNLTTEQQEEQRVRVDELIKAARLETKSVFEMQTTSRQLLANAEVEYREGHMTHTTELACTRGILQTQMKSASAEVATVEQVVHHVKTDVAEMRQARDEVAQNQWTMYFGDGGDGDGGCSVTPEQVIAHGGQLTANLAMVEGKVSTFGQQARGRLEAGRKAMDEADACVLGKQHVGDPKFPVNGFQGGCGGRECGVCRSVVWACVYCV